MTVSIWQTLFEKPRQEEADVCIVGAGLLGCAAALMLRQAGKDVVIVEARNIGLGASSRNAGFLITGVESYYHRAEEQYGEAGAREFWTLSKQTLAYWREVAARHEVWIEQCGSLLLAESREEAAEIEQAARRLEANGFDAEFLSYDPLGRGYHAAVRQPDDGGVHPMQLVRALFADSGARLIADSEVYRIESDGAGVVVHSRLATIRAGQVLLCANASLPTIDPYFEGKVIPTRAQCLATAPLPDRLVNAVGYSDYGYMYYRDLPDGGLLIGGGRKLNKAAESTSEDRTSPAVQGTLDAYLRQRFPEAADVPIVRRWSGIMGYTPDALPLVGTLPRDSRIAFAVGCNGHGLSLGAMVASRAVDMMLTGTRPGLFDAARLD